MGDCNDPGATHYLGCDCVEERHRVDLARVRTALINTGHRERACEKRIAELEQALSQARAFADEIYSTEPARRASPSITVAAQECFDACNRALAGAGMRSGPTKNTTTSAEGALNQGEMK